MRLKGAFIVSLISCAVMGAEPIAPIPMDNPVEAGKAKLGKRLFFETKLSSDGTVACASCHDLNNKFGTDLETVSTGVAGAKGTRNSPTVFNTALNFRQFWDGRAETLAEQVFVPFTNPVEMGLDDIQQAVDILVVDDSYRNEFAEIYQDGVTADNMADAIAEFERTLLTPNSPFDQYLLGDQNAITAEQKHGYDLFKAYGCVACHQGANVGGNMFQKFGVLKDINLRGQQQVDLGRYEVTKNEWDKHVFKVPSLRLVVKTPPYFHDGSAKTIEDAVNTMIEFQLGRTVPDEDRDAIIVFLDSLVGEIPEISK